MLLRNLRIVSGRNIIFIKMKCWHSVPLSLMGSHERPTDVSIFPEGIHHISYACSLCFHISGDGKEKPQRLSVHVFFFFFPSMISATRNLSDTSFDPFLLNYFNTEARSASWRPPRGTLAWPSNSVYREADTSRQSEKQNRHMPRRNLTCSPPRLHRGQTDRQTRTATQIHANQRSHLQVVQQGRSFLSLGLCRPPIGCGCSPSTGHNGPSGRSGCR